MSPSSAIQQAAHAYFYVAIWMGVSISVILFNKWLLAFAGFPFPITLTLWHMAFCSTAGFICVRVLKITKTFNLSVEEYVTRVMPIGTPSCLHPSIYTLELISSCSLFPLSRMVRVVEPFRSSRCTLPVTLSVLGRGCDSSLFDLVSLCQDISKHWDFLSRLCVLQGSCTQPACG